MAYTPQLGNQICESLATGDKSLRQIARELQISHSTILDWAREIPEFANQYARARDLGCDARFDGLQDEMSEQPEITERGVDQGWVAWKRLKVDTLKWELAKQMPKKYGERNVTEIEMPGLTALSERLSRAKQRAE